MRAILIACLLLSACHDKDDPINLVRGKRLHAPEIDPASSVTALTMLGFALCIIRSKK